MIGYKSSRNLARFGGTPYVLTHLGENRDAIRLLPPAMPRARCLEIAGAIQKQSGKAVTLVYRHDIAFSVRQESSLPTSAPISDSIVLENLSGNGDAQTTVTADLIHHRDYFLAWHAYAYGRDAVLCDAGDGSRYTTPPRNEIIQFLIAAHHAADRNPLLEIPVDGQELLATLALYNDLASAWQSGFVWKHWRAWIAEVASASGIFHQTQRRAIMRVHSLETSIPGATPSTFGQALAREFPLLFNEFRRDVLREVSREAVMHHVA